MNTDHNSILRDGPGHGMLMQMDDATQRLVWDSPLREYEPGEYRRSEETEGEYTVWTWHPATAESMNQGKA